MGFIHYNGIVLVEIRVGQGFGKQDPVGHYFYK